MSTISPTPYASRRLPETFFVVALHALLWAAWLVGILLWVPRVEQVLRNFNMKSQSIVVMMALTHGMVPLGLLVVLFFIIADGTVAYRLRRSGVRALWSGLMTLAPVAAILVTVVAVSLPMLRLLEMISEAYHK
jgi:hypothetical protein